MEFVHITKGEKTVNLLSEKAFPFTIRNAFDLAPNATVKLQGKLRTFISTSDDTFNPKLEPGYYVFVETVGKRWDSSNTLTEDASCVTINLNNVRFYYGDNFFDMKANGITRRKLVSEIVKRTGHQFRETSLFIYSDMGVEIKGNDFDPKMVYYLHYPCQMPLTTPENVFTTFDLMSTHVNELYISEMVMPYIAVAKVCDYFGRLLADYQLFPDKYNAIVFDTSFTASIHEVAVKLNAALTSLDGAYIDPKDPESVKQAISDFLEPSRLAEDTLYDMLLSVLRQAKTPQKSKPSFECLRSAATAHIFRNRYNPVFLPRRSLTRKIIPEEDPKYFFQRLPKYEVPSVFKEATLFTSYEPYQNVVLPLIAAAKRFDYSMTAIFDLLCILLKVVSKVNKNLEEYPVLLTQTEAETDELKKNGANTVPAEIPRMIHNDFAACIQYFKKVAAYGCVSATDEQFGFSALKKSLEDAQFAYAHGLKLKIDPRDGSGLKLALRRDPSDDNRFEKVF
uniref:RNA-dependent RNA polymerase n=1 Tax=Panagrellus redivivus TaxID=6233 RepID=A0A7E4WDS0_PANRE